jgi:hypothetical protein
MSPRARGKEKRACLSYLFTRRHLSPYSYTVLNTHRSGQGREERKSGYLRGFWRKPVCSQKETLVRNNRINYVEPRGAER